MSGGGAGSNGNGVSAGAQFPLLGGALGPVTKSIIEASAVLPMLKEVMRFTDADKLKAAFASLGGEAGAPPAVVMAPPAAAVPPPPTVTQAGRVTTNC
jgi:hypothetical protein